jgi:hypothetical protein
MEKLLIHNKLKQKNCMQNSVLNNNYSIKMLLFKKILTTTNKKRNYLKMRDELLVLRNSF